MKLGEICVGGSQKIRGKEQGMAMTKTHCIQVCGSQIISRNLKKVYSKN